MPRLTGGFCHADGCRGRAVTTLQFADGSTARICSRCTGYALDLFEEGGIKLPIEPARPKTLTDRTGRPLRFPTKPVDHDA